MACFDNSSSSSSEHNNNHTWLPMSPRISFSNDFAESHYYLHQQQQVIRNPREQSPPPTSDFNFSVSNNYSTPMMTTADELFFKGQFLPFKPSTHRTTTLREELLVEEDDQLQVSHRRPKSSTRWKGFLGLKKSHIGSKKTSDAFDFTGTNE